MRALIPALVVSAAGLVCGAAAHPHPDPVQSLGVVRHGDGTVTLSWTLPPDPSIVGLTIDRERLDGPYDRDVFILVGLPSDFHDATAHSDRSYRYIVYTRDGAGNLSEPVWVETFGDDHHHGHRHRSHWSCHGAAGALPMSGVLPTAVLLIAALIVFRRRAI